MVDTDVLIVGAGPVGLFCANELIRHGLSCRIVDKKSGLSDKSKALGLHIRTLDVLEDTGFLDQVLQQGHKVEGVLFKSEGKELVNASFSEIEAHRQFLIDLPQNKTEAILYQGLQNKGVDVEWNTEFTDAVQGSDQVTATIKKPEGEEKTITAHWLIACDGAHSKVRAVVNAEFKGAKYPENWWLADLHIDWQIPDNRMVIYIGKEGPLACFPMGNKRYRIVMLSPEGKKSEPDMDKIKQAFFERCTSKAELSEPVWFSQFSIHHRQIEQYRHERIFFAGDAAHIHSPIGGQGLNTGLQDIYNLIWKLALVQKKQARHSLIDSYQLERHPVGEAVLKKTGIMTRMMLLKNPVFIKLRNSFIKFMLSKDSIRQHMIRDIAELSISYRKSPIVSHTGNMNLFKAGEYCPEFKLFNPVTQSLESCRQFLQGGKHHLLLFLKPDDKDNDEHLKLVKSLFEPYQKIMKIHLILPHSEAQINWQGQIWYEGNQDIYKKFNIDKPSLLLVRPDKYLGIVQKPIHKDLLLQYLDLWFPKEV